jgi:hypothetical protein
VSRVWFYRPQWWFQRWSPIWTSSDEYGRRTLVIGWCVTGQIVIAYRTCYCDFCEASREQTAHLEAEETP